MSNKTVKRHGGVLVRVLTTLNEFKAKHGYWPAEIAIQPESLAALVTYHLTPLGFFLIQSKVVFKAGPEGDLVAKGKDRDTYSYSTEMGDFDGSANRADLWLGLDLEN